jgi:predicted Fe-Mo cluster-binding NifX family protein
MAAMKIAISCEGPGPESAVSRRLGVAPWFLITDLQTETLEAVRNPGSSGQKGAGVRAVVLLLEHDVGALLTGYCSPTIRQHLENNGVKVFTGLQGNARDLLQQYRSGALAEPEAGPGRERNAVSAAELRHAAALSWNQLLSMVPMVAGVVLLVGLFNAFVSRQLMASVFSGHVILDTLWGACAGSIFAGNPISSYIIGGELLKEGVSLFAVTAFMLTWVTVGVVQLPAEIAAFGVAFAVRRNIACFLLALPIAAATVLVVAFLTGGAL